MKNNLKILVCYHKDVPLLDFYDKNKDIFIPILCGKENYLGNSKFLLSMENDNNGKNISKYNKYLNELTAIYWAYYNFDKLGTPEYIGLFHYRRHFLLGYDKLNEKTAILGFYKNEISVGTHFMQYDDEYTCFLARRFLNIFFNTIDEKTKNDFLIFWSHSESFWCNMFILHKNDFFNYGKFIIDMINIAIEIINSNDRFVNECLSKSPRALGLLLERITGFYFWKKMKDNELNIINGFINFREDI